MKLVFVTILFCLFPISMVQGQDGNFLDLTKVKLTDGKALVLTDGGGVSVSHDTPFPKMPLKITLLRLDKRSYQMGDEGIYDVVIRNVGREAVVIPWSPDRFQIRPDDGYPAGYLSATLSLVITDKVLGEPSIYGAPLYGSPRVPSSLKKLRPGKTVRIRVPSRWALMSGDAAFLARLPHTFVVRARFSLMTHTFRPSPTPVLSNNSVTVELKKRKEGN